MHQENKNGTITIILSRTSSNKSYHDMIPSVSNMMWYISISRNDITILFLKLL